MPAETSPVWLTDAVTALDLVGEAGGEHQAHLDEDLGDVPVVVLVGAYSTGKSSLLKRLCVDHAVAVPPQLVIDAKPTTAVTYDVTIDDVRWRDTPGLDSASADHGRLADAAAAYADVVVLTLTPELFSPDDEVGRFVAALIAGGPLPSGALHVVLTRGDEQAGVRGGERFGAWADAKSHEAADLLGRVGLPDVPVHVVVADARGRNAHDLAGPEAYDVSRAWDRVGVMYDAIRSGATAAGVQDAAIRRATIYALDRATARVRADLRALDAARDAEDTAVASARRILAALKDFERRARDNLRETLRLAATAGSAASITPRLHAAFEAWSANAACELEDLADEAGVPSDPWRWEAEIAVEDLELGDEDGSREGNGAGTKLEDELRKRAAGIAGNNDEATKLEADLKAWGEAKRKNRVRDHYQGKDGFDSLRAKREAEQRLRELRRRQQAYAVVDAGADYLQRAREERAKRKAESDARDLERELAETQAVVLARKLFDGAEITGWKQHIADVRVEIEARVCELEADNARQSLEHALDRLTVARGQAAS